MNGLSIAFVLFLLVCFSTNAQAQTQEDMKDFSGWLYMEKPVKKTYAEAQNNKSPGEYVFSSLFLFYKTFISSQDGNVCVFTPSCSEYCLSAVKKQGLLLGLANTFDRLSRCNMFAPEKYHIHRLTKKLYDPAD